MCTDDVFAAYEQVAESIENFHIKSRNNACMEIGIDCGDGDATIRVYQVFPGIMLGFNDVRATSFPSYSGNVSNGLKLSYCIEGRIELKMSDDHIFFLQQGDFSIDARTAKENFYFPCKRYYGVELFIHESAFTGNASEQLNTVGIDISALQKKYCGRQTSIVFHAGSRIKDVFSTLACSPRDMDIRWFRLKVSEILLLMELGDLPGKKEQRTFFTTGQVEIARQVKETITEDLSRHYSIEKLAAGYGVSPTSLKNYFRGVYGQNISVFLRQQRMGLAASLLKDTNDPVSDIAAAAGYENASKFAASFKKEMAESPLEYRRKHRCGL